jgi:hypothetical protein
VVVDQEWWELHLRMFIEAEVGKLLRIPTAIYQELDV